MNLPRHIVIVPDGNRRWARAKGRPAFFGHQAGMKAVEEVIKKSLELEIPSLTIWGCSVANVTERSAAEIKFLFRLFESAFKKLRKRKELKNKDIRVQVLGRWEEFFPESLKKQIRGVIVDTKDHKRHQFTMLMAYSGVDEMREAIGKIAKLAQKDKNLVVDDELLKKNLLSKDLPPVDLVIRTGGEPHWSAGLLMWDVAEARLYFTQTFWPAFDAKEFERALEEFSKTERRYGK
jgi:undecaprenyl diphosphate synthase